MTGAMRILTGKWLQGYVSAEVNTPQNLLSMPLFQPFRGVSIAQLLVVVTAAVFLSACASAPVVVEETPPPPPVPSSPLDGFTAVVLDDSAISVRRSATDELRMAAEGDVSFTSVSPDGQTVVMAVGGQLIGFPREGMVNVLSTGSADRVYSGAWSQDGMRFHFGHYVPAGDAMGAGGIETWDRATDDVSNVGCSASKMVLSALPDGSLLVRNQDNIYQVAAEGCGTLRTVDARKLHHVTPSPDGQQLAYILRDLVYNREARSYEPDSTLYLESTAGSEPVKVIGDKYAPRNISWRPDGSELLYDVGPPDDAAQRAVSIYTVSDARSTYLLPPSTSASMTHASMAPGGRHVLYRQTAMDGGVDWQVKTAGSNFSQSLPMPGESISHVQWVNDDHLLMTGASSSYLISVAGASPTMADLEARAIWLWAGSN